MENLSLATKFTTGVSLAALVVLVIFYIVRRIATHDIARLETAPAQERAALAKALGERLNLKTDGLDSTQIEKLALAQLEHRLKRQRNYVAAAVTLTICALLSALVFSLKAGTEGAPLSNERWSDYVRRIRKISTASNDVASACVESTNQERCNERVTELQRTTLELYSDASQESK